MREEGLRYLGVVGENMRIDEGGRRGFLKRAGLVVPGLALANEVPTAAAKGAEERGLPEQSAATAVYDVRAFGATGDGKTVDSAAINRAIDAAALAGGGTIFFRAGSYLCYSIHLKSKVAIYLEQGATIVAADPAADPANGYDLAESNQPWEAYQDYGHNHWHNSLIWGEGLEGVSICGPGLIWGKGLSRGWGAGPKAEDPGVANKAIALKNCRNVLLRDFSILHGGHFGILATGVDNLTIDNLKIDTNRDGMDVDCCRNVRISNCSVNSPWDDGDLPEEFVCVGVCARDRDGDDQRIAWSRGAMKKGRCSMGRSSDSPRTRRCRARDGSSLGRNRMGDSRTSPFRIACLTGAVAWRLRASMERSLRT